MGARIIQLAEIRARRVSPAPAIVASDAEAMTPEFHFWTGASGRRYVHTIYSLIACPELPAGNFILVHRDAKTGSRRVLAIGRVGHQAQSLNLAEIRRRGAELGANEVHVHLLAETAKQSKLVEFDLLTGQSDTMDSDAMDGAVAVRH